MSDPRLEAVTKWLRENFDGPVRLGSQAEEDARELLAVADQATPDSSKGLEWLRSEEAADLIRVTLNAHDPTTLTAQTALVAVAVQHALLAALPSQTCETCGGEGGDPDDPQHRSRGTGRPIAPPLDDGHETAVLLQGLTEQLEVAERVLSEQAEREYERGYTRDGERLEQTAADLRAALRKGGSMTRTRTLTLTRTRTVCGHDPANVVADILDGDFHGGPGGDQAVQWCRTCGAYRRVFDAYGERREGEWHESEGPETSS